MFKDITKPITRWLVLVQLDSKGEWIQANNTWYVHPDPARQFRDERSVRYPRHNYRVVEVLISLKGTIES